MTRRRRPRLAEEKDSRVQRRYAPGAASGQVSNAGRVPRIPRGRSARSGMQAYPLLQRTQFDLLKAPGAATSGTYTLSKFPMKRWPHIVVGGVPALPGIDFTVDGRVVTMQSAARQIAGDVIWAIYDYRVGSTAPPEVDPYTDRPIDVKMQYSTNLGRDFWSLSFDTTPGQKTPADGWAWKAQCLYVDGSGTIVYDGRVYPLRSVSYNSSSGRWELIQSQSPNINPNINRVVIYSSEPGTGENLNPPGLDYPEWPHTRTDVFIGPVQ